MSFDGAVDFYVNKIQIYSKIKLLIKMVIGQARLLFYPCEESQNWFLKNLVNASE